MSQEHDDPLKDMLLMTGYLGLALATGGASVLVHLGWIAVRRPVNAVVSTTANGVANGVKAGVRAVQEAREEAARKQRAEAEHRQRLEFLEARARLQADEDARQPKPLTPAQQAAAAKERYDERVRAIGAAGLDDIERAAAIAQAKQTYLHELGEVL